MKKLMFIGLFLLVGCKHDPGRGTTGVVTPPPPFPPAGTYVCRPEPAGCGGWGSVACTSTCPTTCKLTTHDFGDGLDAVWLCPSN